MAVPPIDFSSLPPGGSRRPGGPGLEAAANRYIERMRREALEKGQIHQDEKVDKKPQTDVDTNSLTTAATQDTKVDPILSDSSLKQLASPSGNDQGKDPPRRSLWESMKGKMRSGSKVPEQ